MYVSVNEIHIDCKTLCSSVLNSRRLVSNKLNIGDEDSRD